MGFVLVMTKEVDLPSAWGHTPLRGFQFARVALKKQDKMRGGFRRVPGPSPGYERWVKRIGLASLVLVLFCSLFRGKKEKKIGRKKKERAGRE